MAAPFERDFVNVFMVCSIFRQSDTNVEVLRCTGHETNKIIAFICSALVVERYIGLEDWPGLAGMHVVKGLKSSGTRT